MLLQIKVYLIATLYVLGALFMSLFPPRNYKRAGNRYHSLRTRGPGLEYKEYVNYDQLLDLARNLSRNGVKDVIASVRFLKPATAENRSLVAFELHSDDQSKKPGILIIGGLNPMAWGVANTILELADNLLHDANYQSPFFNDYDWYLVPMANPDGVQFTKLMSGRNPLDTDEWSRNVSTQKDTRPAFWNKNLDKGDNGVCFGTNINRNFAYHWQDDVHKTPEQCSQYYPGLHPFSTAEAQALRDYLNRIGDKIELAIHLQASFVPKKEYILYPWRYSLRQHSNYQLLQDIGEYAARQAKFPDGRLYAVHQGSSDERVAGSLSDYLSGVVGTNLVFVVKPYFPPFPNVSDTTILAAYTKKASSAILGLVRGWRSSTKQNSLYFFGREIEF